MKKIYLIICAITLVVIVALTATLFLRTDSKTIINDFESCASAGYPIMETYPEQCKTENGTIYVKIIENQFNYFEGLILMQNKDNGEYACFGCNGVMCKDPAPVMETLVENDSLYCDNDYNVIIEGKPSYLVDGVTIYKNTNLNVEGCFGCSNKMCVDIMRDENTQIINETEDKYCNADFEIVQKADIVLIKSDFGDKIVYDSSENMDNLRIDCNARGGNFNECGSVCASDAEMCVMMCGLTCENLN